MLEKEKVESVLREVLDEKERLSLEVDALRHSVDGRNDSQTFYSIDGSADRSVDRLGDRLFIGQVIGLRSVDESVNKPSDRPDNRSVDKPGDIPVDGRAVLDHKRRTDFQKSYDHSQTQSPNFIRPWNRYGKIACRCLQLMNNSSRQPIKCAP